MIFSICSI